MFANTNKNNKPPRRAKNLAQYGIFGLPDSGNTNDMSDEDDGDLEAELNALVGDTPAKVKSPRGTKPPVSNDHLNAMIAESMRDIPEDVSDDGDDDDPELLNELQEIAGQPHPVESAPDIARSSAPSDIGNLLEARLKMYETAETNARSLGETSRARRYARAIKTLKDLIKQAKAGKAIAEADIPPEVSLNAHKSAEHNDTSETKPEVPSADNYVRSEKANSDDNKAQEPKEDVAQENQQNLELLGMLKTRKEQYKIAALKYKTLGDKTMAIGYIKISKQFESVIQAVENGQPVDLSRMPGPPADPQEKQDKSETQKNESRDDPVEPESTEKETLVLATSVEEALLQRLEVYKKQVKSATEEGNSSKARRMGRVVKQFEDALKSHKAGKPVAFDELPTPPGYGPIPVDGSAAEKQPSRSAPTVPVTPPKPPPRKETSEGSAEASGKTSSNHRVEQQVTMLLTKQKEFKLAALSAKQKGEINQAKEYLRIAKGFDPLIDAARGGFPVDLSSLPVSPSAKTQLDDDYDMVMAEECSENDSDNFNLISRLEAQLTKQLKTCLATRDHHKALGDVASTNRFEQLALNVTKDLDIVRLAQRTPGCRIPKFHYENKDFSVVKSFTDLGDNDLELLIVRGINYRSTNPTEIDTYVKFEFPFPQEAPYRDKTVVVKDTNNPEYNSTFTIPIQRTSRLCQRVFKRHGIKFEVYCKGGFFRGDTLLGTATVKLQPLETDCELHDSFDLMEGRKKAGGKLEIRLRIRHPIVAKKIENIHEKWLVLDS